MPKGGPRFGAGRKPALSKLAEQLERIHTSMQRGFYGAAMKLADQMPTLMQKAIEHASGGDKRVLMFLIEQFNKIVAALPQEEKSRYAEYQQQILDTIRQSVGAGSQDDAEAIELADDTSDGGAVLPPSSHQTSHGGREGG